MAPGLIPLSGSMGSLAAFFSGASWAFCTCMERKCLSFCLLTGIHISENKELYLSQKVSAFEPMANLIYFFSQ